MKEWIVRLLCVCLGANITMGSYAIADIAQNGIEIFEETENEKYDVENQKLVVEGIVQDYNLEAELKYQQMQDDSATDVSALSQEDPKQTTGDESTTITWNANYPKVDSDMSLEEKEKQRSSYDETMAVNAFDKKVIENNTVDFSNIKITVIGDSITAGNTLGEEEQSQYNWPAQLQNILGCKEVVNLGIGGSNVSCCSDNFSLCRRWSAIEKDSDIIIVMGGSNDALFETREQFGNIEYAKRLVPETFCGDLDDMLGRMKWTYVENNDAKCSKLIYINPPSTILNDGVYAQDPDNMVLQKEFAEAINTIAPEYGFDVIDLFNNNILNSHDPDINALYVYDGIHCNKEGYRILAEHVASWIIQRIEQ